MYEFAAYTLFQGLTNMTMINMNSANYSLYTDIDEVGSDMIDTRHNVAGSWTNQTILGNS